MKTFTKITKLFRMSNSPFRAAVKPLFFAFLAGNLFFLNCGDSTGDEGGTTEPTTFSLEASEGSIAVESITIASGSSGEFTVNLSKTGPGQIASATLSFTKTNQDATLGDNSITLTPAMIKITESNLSDPHIVEVEHKGNTKGKLTIKITLSITLAGDSTPLEYADSVEVTVVDTTFSTTASVENITVNTGSSSFAVALSKMGSRRIGSATLRFTKATDPQNQDLEDSVTLPQPITIIDGNLSDMHTVTVRHTGTTSGTLTVNIILSVTLSGDSMSAEYTDSVEVTVVATTFTTAASVENITLDAGSSSFAVALSKVGGSIGIGSATLRFTKATNPQNQDLEDSVTLPGEITINENNLGDMHDVTIMHTGATSGSLTVNITLSVTLTGDSTSKEYTDSVEVMVVATTFTAMPSVRSIAVQAGLPKDFTVRLSKVGGSIGIGSATLRFTKATDPKNQNLEDSIRLPQPITIIDGNLGDDHAVTVRHTGTETGDLTVNITLSVTLTGDSTSKEYTAMVGVAVRSTAFTTTASVENITVNTASSSFAVELSKTGSRSIGSATLSFTKTANSQGLTPEQRADLEDSVTLPQPITIIDGNLGDMHDVTILHTGTTSGVLTVNITLSVILAGDSTPAPYTDSVEVTVVGTAFSTAASVENITVNTGSSSFAVELSKVSGSRSIGSATLRFTKATDPQNQDLEDSVTLPGEITINESNLGDMHDVTIMHTGTTSGTLTVNIALSVTLTGESASAEYTDSVEVMVVATTFTAMPLVASITIDAGTSGDFSVTLSKVGGSIGIGSATLSFTKTAQDSALEADIRLPQPITIIDGNLSDMHAVTVRHTGTTSGVLTVDITFSVTLTGDSTSKEYPAGSVEVTVQPPTTFIAEASVQRLTVQIGTSKGFTVMLSKVGGSRQIESATLSFTKTPPGSDLANSITLLKR